MAESVDKYIDLEELGLDDVTETFSKAADHLQSLVSASSNIENEILLELYALYKQGTIGICNTSKPSWYDMKGKAKWESWNKLGSMPQSEARLKYIKLIEELDPSFCTSDKTSLPKESWVTVSTLQSSENVLNDSEKSLIDYVKEGNVNQVLAILEKYDKTKLCEILNGVDENGLGLVHWAADRGSLEILQILHSYGADINLTDSDLQTSLHYAASCGHADCVSFLINNGVDINAKDADGMSSIDVVTDDRVRDLIRKKM